MSRYEDQIRRVHEPFERDHERLRAELMEKLAETADSPTPVGVPALPRRYWTGSTPMRRLIVRIGMTAAVAAAVLAIVGLWPSGGKGPGIAWADVVQKISVFRPYSCLFTWEYNGKAPYSYRELRLNLSRRREERPDGRILIFDLSQAPNRILTLIPSDKTAVEETLMNTDIRQDPDWLRIIANMQNGKAEDLGMKTIDGKPAQGFHRPDEINDFTVWADPVTRLPVRIELRQPKLSRRLVLTEFVFDVRFDEALFSTTPPAGYSIRNIETPGSTKK